jgi:hypothetical protein
MASSPPPADLSGLIWMRRDLVRDGITDREIWAFVKSGEWHRVRAGAYCLGSVWAQLSPTDRYRLLCRAVLMKAHPSTVLTHVSAAIERGAPAWGIPLDEVHTTRTDGRGGRREAGVIHHRNELPQEHVEEVNGVRVSVAARCAVEVCATAGVEPALVTVNGLLHARQTTLDDIRRLAHDTRFWPESLTTALVLRLADPRLESVGESRTWYFFFCHHLPRPEPQVVIRDEQGREFARVDFAWEKLGCFLEFDGKVKYLALRRDGETLEEFLLREKRREEKICLLTGWVCIRITWADLENPERLARRIRAVLAGRSLRGA